MDLVYLDPPFNSNATYNVLLAEQNGSKTGAQLKAFGDTWKWDEAAAKTYQNVPGDANLLIAAEVRNGPAWARQEEGHRAV